MNKILGNPLVRVFSLILVVAAIGGMGILYLENLVPGSSIGSFGEAIWWAIVTMTTVGYGDYTPVGLGSRTLAVGIMFIGIALTSFLTGTIASVIVSRRLRANQGLLPIKVKDHIIICGWHHKIDAMLNTFFSIDEGKFSSQIVLINEEHEDKMQSIKNQHGYSRVKYIRGEFTKENILMQANLASARAVIILPTESPTGGVSDEKTVLATLTIRNINPDIQIIAYAHDSSTITHLKRANADHVVLADNFGSFIIAAHILHPGIPQAVEELLDVHSSHHFTREPIPNEFVGMEFIDLFNHYRKKNGWITIGIYSEQEQSSFGDFLSADSSHLDAFIERKLKEAGKGIGESSRISVIINPADDHVITEQEGAIVIP